MLDQNKTSYEEKNPDLGSDNILSDRFVLVRRINEVSAKLAAFPDTSITASGGCTVCDNPLDAPPPTGNDLRFAVQMRANQRRAKNSEFLAWPAWDMLLELAVAKLEHEEISVSALRRSSGAPSSTALRKLAGLEAAGLIVRNRDDRDQRRLSVRLTEEGSKFVNDGLKQSAHFIQRFNISR